MTIRGYFASMGGATALAWFAWAMVLWRINPDEAGIAGIALFFLTFGFGLVGLLATANIAYRVAVLHRPVIVREARIAFRQAILLSTAACLLLFLASQDVLYSWVVFLVFVGFGGAEYLSHVFDRHSRT